MKKQILSLILLTLSLTTLSGCKKKPWLQNESAWSSNDPAITIVDSYGYLRKGEQTIDFFVWWSPTYKMGLYEQNNGVEGKTNGDDLLNGDISYDGKRLVLTIKSDNVFDSKYKEIVFIERKMTNEDKDYLSTRLSELENNSNYSSN